MAQSEATAEAHPPPAYCVSPGFFINRSTEEGRADREVVLWEGVGFNRQSQRDPLDKYMIKKTHQQAAQYLSPTGWQFTSNFFLKYTHCKGILPPTLRVGPKKVNRRNMREQKTERSWGGCREEECEGFSALGSTSCSDETSSDKTPKTSGWGGGGGLWFTEHICYHSYDAQPSTLSAEHTLTYGLMNT